MMTGVAFTVGALTNVYFYKHEKVVGTLIRTTAEAGVIVKKEPGQPPVRMPCKLIHIDTGDDGVADVDLIAEGLGEKPSKLMPKAVIRELGNGKIEISPRATSFTRSLIRKGEDWMLNPDSIIPTYVTSAMPRWFGVLFLVTLLAAAMSTISSQFHTAGTALGRDVFEQIIGSKGDEATTQRSANIVRIGMIIGIIVAVVFAYQARGGYIIARATAIFFGMCGAAFLPAFIGGLFWRGMTRQGAIASMVTGSLVSTFWLVFVKAAEAGALGLVLKMTENKPSLLWKHPNWPVVDPMFVAMPISILVAVVVSLLTKPPSEQHLQRCFGAKG
jgi:SSS family solute:Na+ symporter